MTKPKLAWLDKEPADLTKCHSKRCFSTIVENRLCAEHNAIWMAQGHKPPMPKYGAKPPDVYDEMKPFTDEAEATIKEVADMPVKTAEDLAILKETASQIQHRLKQIRSSLDDKVRPFEEYTATLKKAHDIPQVKLTDALKLTEFRIKEYERTSMPPAAKPSVSSTVIRRAKASVKPPAKKAHHR